VRPRILRDVPARNLAFRLSPDIALPSNFNNDDSTDKNVNVVNEFAGKRKDDALLRTIASPDGSRVLALYGTANEPTSTFQIDLYNSDGQFLRNLIPPDLACLFPETVAWSPDGRFINFIGRRREKPSPTPTPEAEDLLIPSQTGSPAPSPSVSPLFAPVTTFYTEQIYICNRDGYDLKPLTTRDGLIYFYFAWAPDSHAMVALACKEDEWKAREREGKSPAGRPRLLMPEGGERLLDDSLTDALPVWCPDASKIATAFDTDVAIYDAGGDTPTQGRIVLGEKLIDASISYEENAKKSSAANSNAKPGASPAHASSSSSTRASTSTSASGSNMPPSFNPIVRLEWPSPETLYFKTAYVRLMGSETINTFQRWHLLSLSAQAAVLK
jgi:hypothetical protein